MIIVIIINCKPTFVLFVIVVLLVMVFIFSFDSLDQNARYIDIPSPKTGIQYEKGIVSLELDSAPTL